MNIFSLRRQYRQTVATALKSGDKQTARQASRIFRDACHTERYEQAVVVLKALENRSKKNV